jgi:hypothetical protein
MTDMQPRTARNKREEEKETAYPREVEAVTLTTMTVAGSSTSSFITDKQPRKAEKKDRIEAATLVQVVCVLMSR